MSLNALSTATAGLAATQAAINLVSQNVANAGTAGYVKRTITSVATGPNNSGVATGTITRTFDAAALKQLRLETSGAAYTSTKAGIISQLDSLYGTPGSSTSLDGTMNTFTESLQELSANPTSAAARTTVLGNASAVASQINSAASTVQTLRSGIESQLGTDTTTASTLLSSIASLNTKIQNTTDDTSLADFQDQRDQAINSLSSYMDVKTVSQSDGTVSVMTQSGATLVDRGNAAKLTFDGRGSLDPNSTYSTDPSQRSVGTITATLAGGGKIDLGEPGRAALRKPGRPVRAARPDAAAGPAPARRPRGGPRHRAHQHRHHRHAQRRRQHHHRRSYAARQHAHGSGHRHHRDRAQRDPCGLGDRERNDRARRADQRRERPDADLQRQRRPGQLRDGDPGGVRHLRGQSGRGRLQASGAGRDRRDGDQLERAPDADRGRQGRRRRDVQRLGGLGLRPQHRQPVDRPVRRRQRATRSTPGSFDAGSQLTGFAQRITVNSNVSGHAVGPHRDERDRYEHLRRARAEAVHGADLHASRPSRRRAASAASPRRTTPPSSDSRRTSSRRRGPPRPTPRLSTTPSRPRSPPPRAGSPRGRGSTSTRRCRT